MAKLYTEQEVHALLVPYTTCGFRNDLNTDWYGFECNTDRRFNTRLLGSVIVSPISPSPHKSKYMFHGGRYGLVLAWGFICGGVVIETRLIATLRGGQWVNLIYLWSIDLDWSWFT